MWRTRRRPWLYAKREGIVPMNSDWEQVLLSYLHDPPDKALDIRGHEGRAAGLATLAFGREITREGLHRDTRTEDQLGSVAERLPMPNPGTSYERAVRPEDASLLVSHPLSGTDRRVPTSQLHSEALQETLKLILQRVVTEHDTDWARRRFLALWRCWRDELATRTTDWGLLPAETRLPDHTIWNHMDIVAGLQPALAGNHGAAFLSFSLGPVQTFIAAARSVRDLWSGSYLLSWLTFQAMRPLLDAVGPSAFIFPALRGNPLLDRYLREARQGLGELLKVDADAERLLLPCLPNRFVAVVPWGRDGSDARELCDGCEQACEDAWRKIAQTVREFIAPQFRSAPHSADWDRLWSAQVGSCFEVRTAVLPERECRDQVLDRLLDGSFHQRVEAVRSLARALPQADSPRYPQESAGLWMGQLEVLARLSETSRAVRHVPDYHPEGNVPGKCSLLGSYEQMGPATLDQSREFWEELAKQPPLGGSRIGNRERLCAVSLVKRFAWPAFLVPELGCKLSDRRFDDTATVAAARWLKDAKHYPAIDLDSVWKNEKEWSGQWLHWSRPHEDQDEGSVPPQLWARIQEKKRKQGVPPVYYAVLMIDGDHMGRWLRGEHGPTVREALHPKLRAYFETLPGADDGLKARRPVGPALHASISEALTNFALHFVRDIVGKHDGELIYAGGDDVLALLPAATALACARELSETFQKDWHTDRNGRERLLMGGKSTISAGLAVVHYKEDLRFALDRARRAEKAAKAAGRNALELAVCRRSGEHSFALLPWAQCEQVQELVNIFLDGVSDRWAYNLRAELPTLQGTEEIIPWSMVDAEVRRLLGRLEKIDRDRVQEPALAFLDSYRQALTGTRGRPQAEALEGFVTLCQAASFLARGRDE
jgi:CRISPR-associated protein Cmr2